MKEAVEFFNQDVRLAGTLYRPNGVDPCPAMVVAHSASGGLRTDPTYRHLHKKLPEHGIAVLLYDRRGSGKSSGDFETADFEALAQDAIAGFDYLRLRADIDYRSIGVYGISQGGWIAPIVAAQRPELAFLVIVSGCGVSPAEQMNYAAVYHLREAGYSDEIIEKALAMRKNVDEYFCGHLPFQPLREELGKASREPWFDFAFLPLAEQLPEDATQSKWYYEFKYDPLPIWQQVCQPALFLFAENDRWVPVRESLANYRAATAHIDDVTLAQIEGTDHLMQRTGQKSGAVVEGYLQTLINWLIDRV